MENTLPGKEILKSKSQETLETSKPKKKCPFNISLLVRIGNIFCGKKLPTKECFGLLLPNVGYVAALL